MPAQRTAAGERAGDWNLDELLLTALGLGDLGQSEEGAALVAAAADRESRGRDPVVLYLNIHSNAVAHVVAALLREHQDEWPAPSPELGWCDVPRFTRKMVRTLCPVVRDDSFALFQLVHPLSPEDAYRRHVAGARVARTTWIPGFGEAVASQVKAAMFTSIERLGGRFQAAAAGGDGGPPLPLQILTSHPLDTYVRSAMAEEGVLDYSAVWRRAPARSAPAGRGTAVPRRGARAGKLEGARGAGRTPANETADEATNDGRADAAAKPSPLTLHWLGREDATLWNYVRASSAGATAEEVAAALYGTPAQSRMAFALQKHGDLFQVAPKQARELIASRYPGEVTGHGTARDGAALARSPLGDAMALREASAATSVTAAAAARSGGAAARPGEPDGAANRLEGADGDAPSLPQLLELHFSIVAQLEQLRADVEPLGLAARLEPAFAFRARTILDVTHADDAGRREWRLVWHAQHVHLMMITAVVAQLAAQTRATPPPPPPRVASLRDRISKYLAAAAVAHLQESCAAVLVELAAARRQDLVDQATDAQIGLRDAMRQAHVTPGQVAERGSAEADAALIREQARVLRGGDVEQLQGAQLTAEEVALRTRLQTVRLALLELGRTADEAGAGLSAEIARCCAGKFRRLPALIDAVQLRLLDVERVWAGAERAAPRPVVVADEREEERIQWRARAEGLDAARQAFAKLAGDRDIGTFLRESQRVVSSQRFRSGVVKLAGALVLTVATSGVAAELGAGLAGLVGAGEAGQVVTAGVLAARAGGVAVNLTVNVTVNSAVQYAMSEGREAMGWALVENALMELATRGLGQVLKAPMTQLRSLEQQALREGQRLRELAVIERDAARRGAALGDSLAQERDALRQARADRAGWFVADLTLEVVLGMAAQWAARSLLQAARGPSSSVSDDFATSVLQQGAAIMLGKRLFGLKAAWQARRAELEAQPWFTQLPGARALVERRAAFFGEADALARSLSPELGAGPRLLAHHEELVRLEQDLVAQGNSAGAPRSGERRGAAGTPIGLFGDDTRALAAARQLPPVPGYVDVFVHASADKLTVRRLDADVELTPRQLAAYLRKQGLDGEKLRLVGCSSGAHPDAVAQRLADAHGMEVLAPTDGIWVASSGEHGIGPAIGVHKGTWKKFTPRTKDTAPRRGEKPPTPLEQERRLREGEADLEPPESVHAPHLDHRVRMSSASPDQLAAMGQAMRVPVVVDAALVDGVRILARRVPRHIGFDLVVQEVHVGGDALTTDVLAHTRTIAAIEQYNGLVANLRELRQRLQRSAGRWFGGGQPPGRSAADAATRTARGEEAGERPLEEQPLHFPRGSRGWVTELELRKLHALLEARATPLHQGAVDEAALREECAFLEGRRLLHEEVLRSIDETSLRSDADGDGDTSLERPDTGEVTREALSKGYRLPGPEENARPEWYYYRNSTELPGLYELARRPGFPSYAPGLRARVVGDTFAGFEPLEAARGVEIPHTMPPKEVLAHLRATPGFGEYLKMLEGQGLASAAVVDGVIQHKLNLLGMAGKRLTTEALRGEVRDHFRERVTARLCDPSLSDAASWQRLREMSETLSPTERGGLAELWYRHRHTRGAQGQVRVDVARTSGADEGKIQRRVVDAVEGDTAIEVKDITGPIDRDQFAAYMDMVKTPDDGSAPLFKKVKYVFTKPEGAIANLEYLGQRMEAPGLKGRLTIEVFDYQGNLRVAGSRDEAITLKRLLLKKGATHE